MRHTSPALIVFYDGACPLCRREIAHYRRRDRDARIAFVDVAAEPAALAGVGITQAEALAAMHARRPDGSLVRGAAAFVAVWEQIRGWRHLARLVRATPGLLPLAERIYAWVAPRRARVAAVLCRARGCA